MGASSHTCQQHKCKLGLSLNMQQAQPCEHNQRCIDYRAYDI